MINWYTDMKCWMLRIVLILAMTSPLFADRGLEETVSVALNNASVREVLSILDQQSDMQLVVDPRVRGSVSVQLSDVPLKTALHYILDINGLGFQVMQNSIYVAPKALLKQNAHLETAIVPLQHLSQEVPYRLETKNHLRAIF